MFSSRMKSIRCTQMLLYSLYSTVDETARYMCVFQQAVLFDDTESKMGDSRTFYRTDFRHFNFPVNGVKEPQTFPH